jgi:hypothetical protein
MCIIASKYIDGSRVIAKNRDRAYKASIEIIHTVMNGVEVAYIRDTVTDWSEGMNEYGIGILNTALMVGFDEIEDKIVKKTGKPSKDGIKIRMALCQKTMTDAVQFAVSYDGGVRGHTFVSNPKMTVSIETTSKHSPKYALHKTNNVVRTNHGHFYSNAGYTQGPDYVSSKIRKISAEKMIDRITTPDGILPSLRKKLYSYDSPLNMRRDTDKMRTSSQLLLDLEKRVFHLVLINKNIDSFVGIKQEFPKGYTPKITIKVTQVED